MDEYHFKYKEFEKNDYNSQMKLLLCWDNLGTKKDFDLLCNYCFQIL